MIAAVAAKREKKMSMGKFKEVMKEVENRGVSLPSDMEEAAKTTRIREVILSRYSYLQVC